MAASLPPLVITGASGFVGGRVLHALAERGATKVTALARDPSRLTRHTDWRAEWRAVQCDLASAAVPSGAISPDAVVLHLAASTGKMSPADMSTVNVQGTARVIDAARAANARHLIFVSSIAAGFADQRWYHYARAKRAAERLVSASGLPHSIVRPTMVFGPGSPIEAALAGLATGRAPIVLGSGTVRVQPVHVDDLVELLLALVAGAPVGAAPLEVGGGDRLTLRELLARIRSARALAPRTPLSIPLGAVRLALGAVEPVFLPLLPVTAGQLAAFVNHSDAAPSDIVVRLLPTPRGIDAMLDAMLTAVSARCSPQYPRVVDRQLPSREFAVYARYLGASGDMVRGGEYYRAAHESLPQNDADRFDRWLVVVARAAPLTCGLADAYARMARPYGLLRRKLVLTLAVLESSPGTHAAFDTALESSTATAWLALAALGTGWVLRSAAALLLIGPLHLLAAIIPNAGASG